MLIYLLRHGLTKYNEEKRYQGARDIPLSLEGKRRLRPAEFSPDRLYVSPLQRAEQTAERVFPHSRQIVVNDLREMDFGAFEGRNYLEMEHDPAYRAWIDSGCWIRCPGGESRQEFSDRTCRAFAAILAHAFAEKLETIVLMAHGGTQMSIMERYGLPRQEYYQWCGPHAGGYLTETTEEEWNKQHIIRLLRIVRYMEDGER